MRILLLGKNGQVGWELQRSLAPLGELIALDRHGHADLSGDLSNLRSLRETIRKVAPDIVVNAAAYTAVDKAESDTEMADRVNARASQVIAEEVKTLNAWLVHYSTDYVFSGQGHEPWRETDQAAPVNCYGLSKLNGERAIVASGCRHLIFRTGWVYAARGNNFAKTMLRLSAERETLNVVSDQVGAPTGADLIADVTAVALQKALQQPELAGIYHLVAAGQTSWHQYASYVIDFAREQGETVLVKTIVPVPSTSFPTPARRPLNSCLDTRKVRESFSLHLPEWEVGVTRMLMEILNK